MGRLAVLAFGVGMTFQDPLAKFRQYLKDAQAAQVQDQVQNITNFIQHRIVPTIQGLINEVNLTHGNVAVSDDVTYQIQRTDRVVICQDAGENSVAVLPPVADVKGQRFLVCRESAYAVTVTCQSGEWLYDAIDGFIILGSDNYTTEVYSDGTKYRRVGGYQ